jgi:hypothetical protein
MALISARDCKLKTPPGGKKSSSMRKVIAGVIIASVVLASFYGAMYLLTPYSGFARALIWMESDIKDYEKFSARAINNAPLSLTLKKLIQPHKVNILECLIELLLNYPRLTQSLMHHSMNY